MGIRALRFLCAGDGGNGVSFAGSFHQTDVKANFHRRHDAHCRAPRYRHPLSQARGTRRWRYRRPRYVLSRTVLLAHRRPFGRRYAVLGGRGICPIHTYCDCIRYISRGIIIVKGFPQIKQYIGIRASAEYFFLENWRPR